jgi:hypothetical protein
MRTTPVLAGLATAGLIALTACSNGGSPAAAPAAGAATTSRPPEATASMTPAAAAPARTTAAAPTTAATSTPAATAPAADRIPAEPATRRVVLAPVTIRGTAVAGYRVVNEDSTVDCAGSEPSPASLSRAVHYCGPSAATADVCWASAIPQHVLCLRDPWARVLTQLKTSTPLRPVRATAAPVPLGLVLNDGDRCRLRDGGAWDRPQAHPDYVGFYACTKHEAVWGAKAGINTGSATWTVLVGNSTGPLVVRNVVKAYYVTTAG